MRAGIPPAFGASLTRAKKRNNRTRKEFEKPDFWNDLLLHKNQEDCFHLRDEVELWEIPIHLMIL